MSVTLTQNYVRSVLRYEGGKLFWVSSRGTKASGTEAGCLKRKRDVRWHICLNGKEHKRSRLVWVYHYGEIPEGLIVDHINHDTTDDRIENLRVCSVSQNQQNRLVSKGKFSKLPKGVWFAKHVKRFRAAIKLDGRLIHIGYFDSPEDAKDAYDKAATEMFGQYFCDGNPIGPLPSEGGE